MSEEAMKTIDGFVTDNLEQLSIADNRDATPPPARIRARLNSSPSLVDSNASTEETSPPRPRLCNSAPSFAPKNQAERHHELTPVMRNVSYVDDCSRPNMVSPEEDKITNEHLAIPDPLQSSVGQVLKFKTLPSLPSIGFGDRTKSLVNLSSQIGESEDVEDFMGRNLPIPSRDRFYSFNSRHEYTELMVGNNTNGGALTPYQPSRHDLTDLGSPDTEELSRIFIRKDVSPNPLGERQLSIPSIRMANHLVGGSITTIETEEEDDLRDDASWSSRGSSLYFPEDSSFNSSKKQPVVIVEGVQLLPKSEEKVYSTDINNDFSVNAVKGRKRKSKPEDQAVYEWLRTLERDSAIAEAASSKFLMGERRDFAKQHSSPSDIY